MSQRVFLFMILGLTLAVSCGPDTKSTLVKLEYDESVSKEHRELIEGDLELLSTIKFNGDTENADILDIPSFTGENVATWLQERSHYVVGVDYASSITPVGANSLHAGGYRVLMSNLGAGIYRAYRTRQEGVKVQIAGQEVIVKTPRIGIFRVGEGMFDPLTDEILHTVSSIANGVSRLSTLFHEARHSDGNGDSLVFAHMICPDGDYKGQAACDKWTNGPYAVGAEMTKRLYQACVGGRCSMADRVLLLLEVADSRYRVRSTKRGDPTPVAAVNP